MERTTDLEKIRNGAPFVWGTMIGELMEIGPYVILQFYRRPEKDICYHGWVDGKDTSHSWNSLDAALAGCIAYKREGPNCRAGDYFMKMLRDESPPC